MPMVNVRQKESILTATGRNWQQWSNELKQEKFKGLSCDEIESELFHQYAVDRHWARKITDRFATSHDILDRHQGDRPSYDITVRRTFHLPKEQVIDHIHEWFRNERRAGNTERTNASKIHCQWATDDSSVDLKVHEKAPDRTQVVLHHEHIRSRDDAEIMRNFWKEQIKGMAEAL